jgi:hypothetical protein
MTLGESVRSLAPQRTPEQQKSQAQAALARGQALAAQGDHAGASAQRETSSVAANPGKHHFCTFSHVRRPTSDPLRCIFHPSRRLHPVGGGA